MPSKQNQAAKNGERATTTAPPTSAITLLQQDHHEVEAYFTEYETLKGDQDKEALALKICLALEVHARIEEEIFYPAARGVVENGGLIDEALVEHAAAKQLIGEIEAMEVGDQFRDAKVKVLGEQIQHHVEEEEEDLFPQLQGGKLDLDALGQEMAARKQELFAELAEGGDTL
jgi:hemerythrin superfamily protein